MKACSFQPVPPVNPPSNHRAETHTHTLSVQLHTISRMHDKLLSKIRVKYYKKREDQSWPLYHSINWEAPAAWVHALLSLSFLWTNPLGGDRIVRLCARGHHQPTHISIRVTPGTCATEEKPRRKRPTRTLWKAPGRRAASRPNVPRTRCQSPPTWLVFLDRCKSHGFRSIARSPNTEKSNTANPPSNEY